MKSVTYEEFLEFNPCWLEDAEKAKKLEKIGKRKESWTAIDVLDLPEKEVDAEDKLWAVLREEFIEAPILHEFACRCAEEALKEVKNPDPRSVAAIEAKRKWLRGEIGDRELGRAKRDAWVVACAAAYAAAYAAAHAAAYAAAYAAAHAATCAADWAADCAADYAAACAADCAADWAADCAAAYEEQVQLLREMLLEGAAENA